MKTTIDKVEEVFKVWNERFLEEPDQDKDLDIDSNRGQAEYFCKLFKELNSTNIVSLSSDTEITYNKLDGKIID